MNDFTLNINSLSLQKGSRQILSGIDLELRNGCSYLLFGRNGAGKSTLINCILGFESGYSGDLVFQNKEGEIDKKEFRFSYLPENIEVSNHVVVEKYMSSVTKLFKEQSRFDQEWFDKLQTHFDTRSYQAKEFGHLSKGMRKILLICLVLSSKSDLYILDEPFEGLDMISKHHLVMVLNELQNNNSIVLVSSHEAATFSGNFSYLISIKNGNTRLLEMNNSFKYNDLLSFI